MLKTKLRSKVVWITAIPLIATMIAHYIPSAGEEFTTIATTVVGLLALFGILNNPDSKENF